MRKTVLAAAAAFAVASGAMTIQASAADLDFAPPPPPFVPTWQGFYIGGHVGYGEADFDAGLVDLNDFEDDEDDIVLFEHDLTAGGILGGVHGGYNWQIGSFVLGIEGDISFTDWDDDDDDFLDDEFDGEGGSRAQVDFLASVRGRAGIAFDQILLYGTGGIAFADGEVRVSDGDTSGTAEFDDIGWVVGGGAEWMVIPQTFSVGVEGLWYFFDDDEDIFDDDDEVAAEGGFDDAWVVRARASFHF
jgi:outer membrane immunogenic protein